MTWYVHYKHRLAHSHQRTLPTVTLWSGVLKKNVDTVTERREAGVRDIESIVSFHNATYGNSRTPEQWIWEYKGNDPESSVFVLITDNGRVIATQGMLPIDIFVRGRKILSGKSESTLLDPKYRGGTIFSDLYEFAVSKCKDREMHCIWGYTGAIKAFKKFQFRVFDIMYDSSLLMDFQAGLSEVWHSESTFVRKIAASIRLVLVWLRSTIAGIWGESLGSSKNRFSIKENLESQADLDELYERLRTEYPDLIHIAQDEGYLKWRILDHPFLNYTRFFVYEKELLRAYVYVNASDRRIAYLTDFTFEDAHAGYFLLQRVLKQLRQAKKPVYVSFFGNAENPLVSNVFDLLRRFGFSRKRARSSMSFVVRNLSLQGEDEQCLFDVRNWYMCGLWTDGFRM